MGAEEELQAAVREIQERVSTRHRQGEHGRFSIPLAELMPLLHARDAAEAKVAAIGTVNPRPPGLKNNLIQGWKRMLARVLDWHVREQVEFNRGSVNATQATLEALGEVNRALQQISAALEANAERLDLHEVKWGGTVQQELTEMAKARERSEVHLMRSVADLHSSFQHQTNQLESNFRDIVARQHREYEAAMARSSEEIQRRFWEEAGKARQEFERVIHSELRTIRQKAFAAAAIAAAPAPAPQESGPQYDFVQFANRFRGPQEYVRRNLEAYLPLFAAKYNVVDLGCGRGEFLEAIRERGGQAHGIDADSESVGMCRAKGLEAEEADLFEWLEQQPDHSLDGIFCSQVIEHLPPTLVPRLINLCGQKAKQGAVAVFETPNPECLAIFATHFYLDPTHQRPVPPSLAVFYLEEAGFGRIEVRKLAPAVDTMPSLASLPADFREAFFGCLDYAVIGVRL